MREGTDEERRKAKPARHVSRESIPSLQEAEERLWNADAQLAELVEEYDTICMKRSHAQAAWERHLARIVVEIADSGERTAEDVRKARAQNTVSVEGIMGSDLYEAFLLMSAAEASAKKRMDGLSTRISSMQTNVKLLAKMTGIDI